MKKAIYTAVIGEYDEIRKPNKVNDDYDYILFTNLDIESNFWKVVKVEGFGAKVARKIKIRPDLYLPEYDLTVWLDANIVQNCDIDDIVDHVESVDMVTMQHPSRNCIYQEVEACKSLNKDSALVMDKQVARYKANGYPEDNGLIASGILVRKNNWNVKHLMKDWWYEVSTHSKRDQLSFNYCLEQSEAKINLIPFNVLQTHFLYLRHK